MSKMAKSPGAWADIMLRALQRKPQPSSGQRSDRVYHHKPHDARHSLHMSHTALREDLHRVQGEGARQVIAQPLTLPQSLT